MDNYREDDWTNGGGVEVEGDFEVLPGRHFWGKGGMAEEVQCEFRLREDLVPEEVEEGIGDADEDGKEVSFRSAGDTFSDIAVMDIW